MQTLSVWPPKGDLCVVPRLDLELGSTLFSRRSRKTWGSNLYLCSSTSYGSSFANGNSRYSRSAACCCSWNCGVKSRFLFKHCRLKFLLFCEAKRGSFYSSGVLARGLDHQEIEGEFHSAESSVNDGLSREDDSDDVNCRNLGRQEDSDDNIAEEENGEETFGNEEGKKTRIDVRALAYSLHSAKTVDDVEEVLKDKGELPLQVYSSVIRGLGWDKKMDSALALVAWLKKKEAATGSSVGPNIFIYNSLLSAVKQSEQYEETEKIMNEMTEEGIVPNVVTFNILMVIYVKQGQAKKALDILHEMEKKGFSPSAASYSTALSAYRGIEDGNGALNLFIDIKEKYMKGELGKDADEDWGKEIIKLENFTIRVCCQVMRRWLVGHENLSASMLNLLIDMDKAGLRPGRADYERLVWACTHEDHHVVGKELYNRIRERNSEISLSVCNHLIWLMGKAKRWWAALEIYEDLLDKGPQPNNMSYELIMSHFNILLTAARKRGIWRWGVRLLNKMEEKGLKPGSKQWNAVLVACSKASETSAAVQIFRRMVEQGEKPTTISYGALLSALEKRKLYDEAVRVWEHMLKVGVQPNLYAYTTMVSVLTGQKKFGLVDFILKEMASSGIEPTVVTYNAIITGCARNNMSSAAYEWFHRMKVQNITPNEITYEMLIEALAKDGKPRLAYELYLRARNEGLDLSAKAYDAVLLSSQSYGATIDISVLGPRPPDKKKSVQIRKTLKEFCNLADVSRRSKPFNRQEIYASQAEGSL